MELLSLFLLKFDPLFLNQNFCYAFPQFLIKNSSMRKHKKSIIIATEEKRATCHVHASFCSGVALCWLAGPKPICDSRRARQSELPRLTLHPFLYQFIFSRSFLSYWKPFSDVNKFSKASSWKIVYSEACWNGARRQKTYGNNKT